MPFGFRRRRNDQEKDGPDVSTPALEQEPAAARPTPLPASALPPPPSTRPATTPIAGVNGIRTLPLKDQATGTDARAERFFRQVRQEVDDLRRAIGQRRHVDHEFAELDVEAVVANPEAAASIPPEVLVKALVETHQAKQRLQRKLERSRERNERLRARIVAIEQERAYERGRLETLDRVIAALHGNLEDLRLARDSDLPRLESGPEPRILRPAAAQDALPPAENA